tara:strand:+ start:433 stop:1311 length:879 start_codon:yes stop_codon:yes gene_type:complete
MDGKIVNIAGYRFVDLPDRDELRQPFRDICSKLNLKGTILLSHEGINFFLAGLRESIDSYIDYIEQDSRFKDITLKQSYTDYQPFNRMNVRLKKEIISIGLNHIKPAEFTGEEITPVDFKQLLDDGKEVLVLDTRNDYECRIGTFENAMELDIKSFRDFPRAVSEISDEYKDTPVVMFCTGGIRCEKASVVMMDAGFSNVKQLKGGILGYFEEVGGAHWDGDCFVFDQRVAVNPELKETEVAQCFACRNPLSIEDQKSEHYEIGISCPYCIGRRTGQSKISHSLSIEEGLHE